MQIIEVRKNIHFRQFLRLPRTIFKGHPCYIPPIWLHEKRVYTARGNPMLADADFKLLLVLDAEEKPVARAIVYIDHKFNRYYQSRTGFFGAFECVEDSKPASLLIQTAEEWLRARYMTSIRGPINPTAENWGFVSSGYDREPVFMSPWNPPYYHDYFTVSGYEKVKDLLVYEANIKDGYKLPARFSGLTEKFRKLYPGLEIRRLDLRNLKEDARAIWEISNAALANNWGYVPLELPVMEDMLKKLKMIIDPDAVWIAQYNGEAVGFCLGFPDINKIICKINGHLLPLGWIKLLYGAGRLQDYRLFGLAVHPQWQGKALDALMYINLYDNLAGKKVRMEANYILEDNFKIGNALEKLGMHKIKTYRIYEKRL